ncbi:MAG: single-stranded DNA-binding protein [Candidatus Acidiferrales bacterium]
MRPETLATPLRGDSLKPSDIAPIELHKSKTPGPLVPPFLGSAPSGAEPNDTSGGRTSPIPHNQFRNTRWFRRSRSRTAPSEGQRHEVHRAFGPTQRSWKNAEDEWVSKTEWHRVAIFRTRLAQYVLDNLRKGSHVLVEGSLISSMYERPGKGKKAATTKITSWSIRADAVRRLDRGEPEPEAITSRPAASDEAPETSGEALY